MSEPAFPKVPAHVLPYVEVLGTDGAISLFMTLGGTLVYLGKAPTARNQVAEVFGPELAGALAMALSGRAKDSGYIEIPLAKPWIASVRRAEGRTVQAIAREMHATEATVRRWLRTAETSGGQARPTGQLSLL